MFAGDMLFYGQWGSGADAVSGSLAVVSRMGPERLMLGGFMSILGGLGYVAGAAHVYRRMEAVPPLLRWGISAGFLSVAVISTATHAVWGSFALAVAGGATQGMMLAHGLVIWNYLSLHFLIGGVVAVPTCLLLLGVILRRRTDWPLYFAVVNPGLIYLVLSKASFLPAPIGAAVVGGGFNLAFVLFYGLSLLSGARPTGAVKSG